jgi:hypothetical protein
MDSPLNSSYFQNFPSTELEGHHDASLPISSPNNKDIKIIDVAMQGLDNVRKFLLNYE